jgi:hypothetical protein
VKCLSWLLAALYVLLIAGLALGPVVTRSFNWNDSLAWLGLAVFLVGSQLVFILVPGSTDCLMPVRQRRLVVPMLIGSLMMALLVGGLVISVGELAMLSSADDWPVMFWMVTAAMWVFWSCLFWILVRGRRRFSALGCMVTCILAGSLLQLLVTIPSHIIVSRRPGCMVGMFTAVGLFAGLFVMTWAFGPGIALLFWWETRKRTAGHCPKCGYNLQGLPTMRCPECGRSFTLQEVHMTAEQLSLTGAPPFPSGLRCPKCNFINAEPADRCGDCGLDLTFVDRTPELRR